MVRLADRYALVFLFVTIALLTAACAAPDGGCDAIISIQTSASASGSLHAGSAGGATLSLLPLPYPLLEDI